MPQRPSGAAIRLYRRIQHGRLLRLNICDTRLYRTRVPCGGGTVAPCADAFDPTAQMLGPAQERWLMAGFRDTPARWNAIVQGVPMVAFDRDVHPDIRRFSMDKWDGYQAPRSRLLEFLGGLVGANAVSLAGDIHRHVAATLRADASRPDAPAAASEFVTTSISSGGSRHRPEAHLRAWIDQNPGIDYVLDRRGYVRCTVRPELWRADFRVVDDVARRGAPARTAATYAVEAGRAGVLRA